MTPVTYQLKTANPPKKKLGSGASVPRGSGPRLGIDALLAKAFRLRLVGWNQQGIL